MKLVELTKKEFDAFAECHLYGSFQQSSAWARFKEMEGWYPYFIGLLDKEKLIAATLLLATDVTALKGRIFYAPRGFLLDYNKEMLVALFTEEIVNFVKQKQGLFLKIDPYVSLLEMDEEGNMIPGAKNHDFMKQNLFDAGFTEIKTNLIQPKWLYQLPLLNKTSDDVLKELDPKTRQVIHQNEKLGFIIRDLSKEELPLFVSFMEEVSKTYQTISYMLPFYEDLFACFGKEHLHIKSISLSFKEAKKSLQIQLQLLEKEKSKRIEAYHEGTMKEETFIQKELIFKERLLSLTKRQDYLDKLQEEKKTETVLLGAYLFINYGEEITVLQGNVTALGKKLHALETLHYEMIREAIKKQYCFYNFYEIPDPKDTTNPFYSSYQFKQNFHGRTMELLGEFDYVIDKKKYKLATLAFKEYLGVKIVYRKKE